MTCETIKGNLKMVKLASQKDGKTKYLRKYGPKNFQI